MVLNQCDYTRERSREDHHRFHRHFFVQTMCALASVIFISCQSVAASPLQSLIEEYDLRPHSILYDGPIEVKLPSGTFMIRNKVFRFGPSPFPLTLELNYDPESSDVNGLSPGWSLDGMPWNGYNLEWKTSWGEDDRLIRRAADEGKNIFYHYDGKGRLAGISTNAGYGWEMTYDDHGRVQYIRDTIAREVKMHYSPNGHLLSVEFPGKKRCLYRYDKKDRIENIRYLDGSAVQIGYDERDRVTKLTGAAVLTFEYKDHQDQYTVKIHNERRQERTYRFDRSKRWISVAITGGPEITYRYDESGRLIELYDSLGRVETFRYDATGNLIEHTDVSGGKTQIDYTDNYPVRVISPSGDITQIEYDEKGRRVRETNGLSREQTWTYDETGRVLHNSSNGLGTIRFEYSQEGHLIKETRPNGLIIRHRYDHQGRWIGSDNDLSQYAFDFSDDGFLKRIILNGVDQSIYEYDSMGRVTDYTWLGRRFEYKWDDSSRLTQVTDPSGTNTQYRCHENGELTEMATEGAAPQYFKTNTLGRVVWKDIGVSKTHMRYDRAGRPSHMTNGRGQEIRFRMDWMDRLIQIRGSDGAGGSCSYDTLGNLVNLRSPGFEQRLKYDTYGNVVEIRDSRFPEPVGFEYDIADRRTCIIVPGKGRIEYAYDANDRLLSIRDIAGGEIKFVYGPNFQRKAIFYPNGVIVSYDHDGDGRMTEIRVEGPGGKPIAKVSYVYDRYGQPIRERDTKGRGWMVYLDRNGQIASIADGAGQITTLRYDERGNLLKAGPLSWAYDTSNRMVSTEKELFLYDKDGNLSTRQAHTRVNYEWDSLNRLTRIEGIPGGTLWYQYDLLDRRISKKVGNKQTHYFVDDYDVLFEFDLNKEIRRLFFLGTEIDELFGVLIGDEIFYIIQDGMRNVRWITDVHGNLVGELNYDLWGNVEGDFSILTKIGYGYRGREYDAETGLYYFRARYYDPGLRRFISVDPDNGSMDMPITMHPYLFLRNNPVLFNDPFGTREKWKSPFTRLIEFPGRVLRGGYEMARDALKAGYDALVKAGCTTREFTRDPKKFTKDTAKKYANKAIDTGLDMATGTGERLTSSGRVFGGGLDTAIREDNPQRYQQLYEERREGVKVLKDTVQKIADLSDPKTKLIRDAALAGSNPNDRERMKGIIKVYSEADKAVGDSLVELLKKPVNAFTKSELERVLKERYKTNLIVDGDLRYLAEKKFIPSMADKAIKGAENLGKSIAAEKERSNRDDVAAVAMAQKMSEDEAKRRAEEQARKSAEEEAKKTAEEARQKATDDAVSKALATKDKKDMTAKADTPVEPAEPPKPPEKPPLPEDENGRNGEVLGRGFNTKEIEQIKKQYGVEEVIGGPGDFWIHKDGKWMRPEGVKGSTVTPKSQEDDPTKDPLYAGAGNLWDAKNIEESGKPPDYYGETSEKYGDDLKEKTRAAQDRVIALNEDRRKESSTDHTHKKTTKKTKRDTKDKTPGDKAFKCKSNQDCWDHYNSMQYYCNKGNGKCIQCPEGSHGKKDGSPECCKDEPGPQPPAKTEDATKFPKIYSGSILITLPGCSSNQAISVSLEDHTVGPKNLEIYKYNLVANYGFSIKYDKEKGMGSVEAGKITPHYGYHYSDGRVSILTLGLKGNYTEKKLDGEGGYKKSGVYGDYSVTYQISLSRQK